MLAGPCFMHGSLAFGCVLLCKGALRKFRIVLLMPLHQLEAGYTPVHFHQLDVLFHGSCDSMTVVTYIVFLNTLVFLCNCMALLIVAIIAACVKLITIACEYTSPSCSIQLTQNWLLAKQLSLLLYSHNLVYMDLATIHHSGNRTDSTVASYHASQLSKNNLSACDESQRQSAPLQCSD